MIQMRSRLNLAGAILASLYFFCGQSAFATPLKCAEVFGLMTTRAPVETRISFETRKTPQEAWPESVQALRQIEQRVYGRSEVIEALTTAILAKEFVWINGEDIFVTTHVWVRFKFDP